MVTITSNKHAGELADATINEDSDDYMFQQDGCPAHFHNDLQDYLNTNLPQR